MYSTTGIQSIFLARGEHKHLFVTCQIDVACALSSLAPPSIIIPSCMQRSDCVPQGELRIFIFPILPILNSLHAKHFSNTDTHPTPLNLTSLFLIIMAREVQLLFSLSPDTSGITLLYLTAEVRETPMLFKEPDMTCFRGRGYSCIMPKLYKVQLESHRPQCKKDKKL